MYYMANFWELVCVWQKVCVFIVIFFYTGVLNLFRFRSVRELISKPNVSDSNWNLKRNIETTGITLFGQVLDNSGRIMDSPFPKQKLLIKLSLWVCLFV